MIAWDRRLDDAARSAVSSEIGVAPRPETADRAVSVDAHAPHVIVGFTRERFPRGKHLGQAASTELAMDMALDLRLAGCAGRRDRGGVADGRVRGGQLALLGGESGLSGSCCGFAVLYQAGGPANADEHAVGAGNSDLIEAPFAVSQDSRGRMIRSSTRAAIASTSGVRRKTPNGLCSARPAPRTVACLCDVHLALPVVMIAYWPSPPVRAKPSRSSANGRSFAFSRVTVTHAAIGAFPYSKGGSP